MLDVYYDFQAEVDYKDSDKYSKTLQRYHQLLWSKPLPNGNFFGLQLAPDNCLRYKNGDLELILSSDRAVATLIKNRDIQPFINEIGINNVVKFKQLTDTIGGIVIWPARRIDGKITINGHRGFSGKISDRLDLTIECIRRYYNNQDSPLFSTLKRYHHFFDLFESFRGYIDFFLLNDYITDNYECLIAPPYYPSFDKQPIPSTLNEYKEYIEITSHFVKARNERIRRYSIDNNLSIQHPPS